MSGGAIEGLIERANQFIYQARQQTPSLDNRALTTILSSILLIALVLIPVKPEKIQIGGYEFPATNWWLLSLPVLSLVLYSMVLIYLGWDSIWGDILDNTPRFSLQLEAYLQDIKNNAEASASSYDAQIQSLKNVADLRLQDEQVGAKFYLLSSSKIFDRLMDIRDEYSVDRNRLLDDDALKGVELELAGFKDFLLRECGRSAIASRYLDCKKFNIQLDLIFDKEVAAYVEMHKGQHGNALKIFGEVDAIVQGDDFKFDVSESFSSDEKAYVGELKKSSSELDGVIEGALPIMTRVLRTKRSLRYLKIEGYLIMWAPILAGCVSVLVFCLDLAKKVSV